MMWESPRLSSGSVPKPRCPVLAHGIGCFRRCRLAALPRLHQQHINHTLDQLERVNMRASEARHATYIGSDRRHAMDERLAPKWQARVGDGMQKLAASIARKDEKAKVMLEQDWTRHLSRIGYVIYDAWGSFVLSIVLFVRWLIAFIRSWL